MITRAFQTPVRDGNNFAKLFNKLQEDGKYSKSFEDFEAQFGNDEGAASYTLSWLMTVFILNRMMISKSNLMLAWVSLKE